MPATRPSTRVQRRAQPIAPRPASSRRRASTTTATSLPTTAAEGNVDHPSAAIVTSSTPTTGASLSDVTIQQIVSAVSQAVLASLNATGTPTQSRSASETGELPVFASGIVSPSEDATTQGHVASALQHVSGENFIHVSQPTLSRMSNFNSVSVTIDAQVSAKLKAKIWANEFFDFGLLLNSGAGDTRYQLSVSSQNGSSLPTLSLEPTQKAKHIANIETWTSAFQIFVGVYTGKYPMEAPALMKYGEVVRDLAARGGDWRFYDTQFRNLRQTNPSEMPWGSTHWELWIRAQNFNNSRFQSKSQPIRNNFTNAVAGPFVPRGFCRKFHRGTECQGCNFPHKCFKCGVVHPAVRCNFRPSRAAFNSTSSAAKSRSANASSH